MNKFVSIFFAILIVACSNNEPGWRTWESKDGSVSMQRPIDWKLCSFNNGELIALMDNLKSDHPSTMILREVDNTENKHLNELTDYAISHMFGGKNFEVLSSETVSLSDKQYVKSVIQNRVKDQRIILYVFLKDTKIYVFLMLTETGNYDKIAKIGDKTIESLRVSGAAAKL